MFGIIFFFVISIALMIIILIKRLTEKQIIYTIVLILQILGIVINLICLMCKVKINIFLMLTTYLISVILPIIIIIGEYKKINLSDGIYILIAKAYALKKDTKNEKKILLTLIDKNNDNKEAHKMLAEIYEKEGGLRKAIDEYVKVVDLDGKAYDSYYKIAILLKELGNKEDSQNMLSKLVDKKPDYLEANLALADSLCEQERYKEAINLMNELLKYHPNNFEVLYNMGMIYTMLNDFSTAKEYYEKAAIINSLVYNTTYNIAMIELILGELEDAEQYFNKCLDDEELSASAYYQLAKIYMLKSDRDTAIKALNIAIELDNALYKKAVEEEIFIPIKGYINYPVIDEEDIEEKKSNSSKSELKVKQHLEEIYNLVGKLNYKEMSIRYGNTKEKTEEKYR